MPRSRSQNDRKGESLRLRNLREALGLSQRAMALEFHVAHGAIAAWESGARTVPGPVLRLLELYEEELGIEPKDLGIRGLKTSQTQRNLELSRVGLSAFARVGGSMVERMLGSRANQSAVTASAHTAIARSLTETLGNLKGVAMKLGQVLAYADFAVPEDVRSELQSLLVTSAPLAPSVVARIFSEELGSTPRQVFSEWNPTPFAAASIGQVHRARLPSGEEVAVKIQYPAIVDAVTADLENAALLDRLGTSLFRGQEPGVWFEELSERFREECDYLLEAENQELFREKWADRPFVKIPRVIRELSTKRVLVSEFVSGQAMPDFIEQASQETKNRAGLQIWRFALESIFRHGVFNTDPHPGNYLFSAGHVAFLDFGCVKRFSPQHVALWKQLIRSVLERDFTRAREAVIATGMAPSNFDFDHHVRVLVTLYEPWLTDAPFEFTPEFVERTWRAFVVDNPNRFRFNVPKDWIVVNRLHWGLYSVLGRLRVSARFRAKMLDLLYEPGEARPKPYSTSEMSLLLGQRRSSAARISDSDAATALR